MYINHLHQTLFVAYSSCGQLVFYGVDIVVENEKLVEQRCVCCITALRLTAERLMSSREQLVISSPLCECWKNVQFAARPLAPYPDMALGPGRSHMNRFDII